MVLLVLLAVLYLATRPGGWIPGLGRDPGAIMNPVYAAVRFRTQIQDRSFEMVEIARTFDHDDCNAVTGTIIERMQQRHRSGIVWELETSHCVEALDARSQRLFENKPTFVNYIAASPGASGERELRLVIWGVTAEEGDLICSEIPRVQDRWMGSVSCVHAVQGE